MRFKINWEAVGKGAILATIGSVIWSRGLADWHWWVWFLGMVLVTSDWRK